MQDRTGMLRMLILYVVHIGTVLMLLGISSVIMKTRA